MSRLVDMCWRQRVMYAALLCLWTGLSHPASADHWPLEVGNSWTYQHTWFSLVYPESLSVEIQGDTTGVVIDVEPNDYYRSPFGQVYLQTRAAQYVLRVEDRIDIGGTAYFQLSNGQTIRRDPSGTVFELVAWPDGETSEVLLFDFSIEVGSYSTVVLPYFVLMPIGQISLAGPVGAVTRLRSGRVNFRPATYSDVITFDFSFGVAEGYAMSFAAGVGPVHAARFSDSILGNEAYNLTAAEIGGQIVRPTSVQLESWAHIKQVKARR